MSPEVGRKEERKERDMKEGLSWSVTLRSGEAYELVVKGQMLRGKDSRRKNLIFLTDLSKG